MSNNQASSPGYCLASAMTKDSENGLDFYNLKVAKSDEIVGATPLKDGRSKEEMLRSYFEKSKQLNKDIPNSPVRPPEPN